MLDNTAAAKPKYVVVVYLLSAYIESLAIAASVVWGSFILQITNSRFRESIPEAFISNLVAVILASFIIAFLGIIFHVPLCIYIKKIGIELFLKKFDTDAASKIKFFLLGALNLVLFILLAGLLDSVVTAISIRVFSSITFLHSMRILNDRINNNLPINFSLRSFYMYFIILSINLTLIYIFAVTRYSL